jgi:hypothetical protein
MSYQVFVSRKKSDESGNQTREVKIARELHQHLDALGIVAFLDDVSLEESGTAHYKKTIDDALDSAIVLVAVGTSTENLESRWVRYEWDGFFNDIISGFKPDGQVYSLTSRMSAKELPRALRQTQWFDYDQGGLANLCNFISNALGDSSPSTHDPTKRFVCCLDLSESKHLYAHGGERASEMMMSAYEIIKDIAEKYSGEVFGPMLEEFWLVLPTPKDGFSALTSILAALSAYVSEEDIRFRVKGVVEYGEAVKSDDLWTGAVTELVFYLRKFPKEGQFLTTGGFDVDGRELLPTNLLVFQRVYQGRFFYDRQKKPGALQLTLSEVKI